jgi:hypothetical protein
MYKMHIWQALSVEDITNEIISLHWIHAQLLREDIRIGDKWVNNQYYGFMIHSS